MKQLYFLIFLIPFIFGCEGKKGINKKKAVSPCEAKLIDVPFPFNICPKAISTKKDSCEFGKTIVVFDSNLSQDELRSFYHKEMERIGWKELFVCESQKESLFLYERPHKLCVIGVTSFGKKSKIKIFLGSV